MPCCAFAAFLVLQLLAPFTVLRRRLFGEQDKRSAAAAWRHGEPAPAAAPAAVRPQFAGWRGKAAVIVAAELLALAAVLAVVRPGVSEQTSAADWDALVALHTVWCGSQAQPLQLSLEEKRQ